MSTTREVAVLADFIDAGGEQRHRGDVITVAYDSDRQRREVNSMVYRAFLTLDVDEAKKHFEEDEAKKAEAEKKAEPKKTAAKATDEKAEKDTDEKAEPEKATTKKTAAKKTTAKKNDEPEST
jgi:hypothetical protein